MDWKHLSTLVAVARAGSMLGAAKRLGIDQTTVSRRLRQLEEDLGVQLVTRHRDGVVLTDAGLRAARSGEQMETLVQDLERDLLGAEAKLAGRLQITTLAMVTHYHADLFSTFQVQYPGVELEVEVGRARRSLARREADVAIRWTLKPDPGLVGRRLTRAAFGVYAASELRKSRGGAPSLSEFPWIAPTPGTRVPMIEDFMAKHAADAHVVCRYDDALSMHAAIRDGFGIGLMPCAFGDADPALVRLPSTEPAFELDVWCLTHPDLRATGRVRAFMQHAATYFDACRDRYAGDTRQVVL